MWGASRRDANHDGTLDDADPVWPSLFLWMDLNHDGVSQPSEISSLSTGGVMAIIFAYHWTGRRDPSGNTLRHESHVRMDNGHRGSTRSAYDVFFVSAP